MKINFLNVLFVFYISFVLLILMSILVISIYAVAISTNISLFVLLKDVFFKFWKIIFIVPLIPSIGCSIIYIRGY